VTKTKKRTKLFLLVLVGIIVSSLCLQIVICNSYARITKLESFVDEIGVLYREETRRTIESLKFTVLILATIQAAILIVGVFALLLAVQPKQTEQDRTKRAYSLLLPKLFTLLLMGLLLTQPHAHAENLYYRPRAEITRICGLYDDIRLDEASATMTIKSNRVCSGFTSYMVAYGCRANDEFLEIGYCQDATGLWLYSSQKVGDNYRLQKYFQPEEGAVYNFGIKVSLDGLTVIAYIDEVPKAIVELAQGTFTYVVQGETNCPFNRMANTFTDLLVGYWRWIPDNITNGTECNSWVYKKTAWHIDYTTVTDEYPYDIAMTTGSPFYIAADVSGGFEGNPGGDPNVHPQAYGLGGGESPKPH